MAIMDWEEINKIVIRNRITISCFRTKNNIINEYYNLGIIFSSAESRALEYQKLFSGNRFDNSLLIKFKLTEYSNLRENNDSRNYKFLKKISKKAPLIISDMSIGNIKENIYNIIMKIP